MEGAPDSHEVGDQRRGSPALGGRSRLSPGAKALLGDEPGPIFVFAGLLGLAQGLEAILDLATALPASVPGRFVLIDDGPVRGKLERRIAAERISRVKLLRAGGHSSHPRGGGRSDHQPRDEHSRSGAEQDYEAMASSLPILLIADGEPARRVADAKCGLSVAPGEASRLRAYFETLAKDTQLRTQLGKAGRLAAETTYDRTKIAQRLDAFLLARVTS